MPKKFIASEQPNQDGYEQWYWANIKKQGKCKLCKGKKKIPYTHHRVEEGDWGEDDTVYKTTEYRKCPRCKKGICPEAFADFTMGFNWSRTDEVIRLLTDWDGLEGRFLTTAKAKTPAKYPTDIQLCKETPGVYVGGTTKGYARKPSVVIYDQLLPEGYAIVGPSPEDETVGKKLFDAIYKLYDRDLQKTVDYWLEVVFVLLPNASGYTPPKIMQPITIGDPSIIRFSTLFGVQIRF